jgi:hypothetical protein
MKCTVENVLMKPEFEFTENIQNLLNGYDEYYMYIDDGGQYDRARNSNEKIKTEALSLGVIAFGDIVLDTDAFLKSKMNSLFDRIKSNPELLAVFQRLSQR